MPDPVRRCAGELFGLSMPLEATQAQSCRGQREDFLDDQVDRAARERFLMADEWQQQRAVLTLIWR